DGGTGRRARDGGQGTLFHHAALAANVEKVSDRRRGGHGESVRAADREGVRKFGSDGKYRWESLRTRSRGTQTVVLRACGDLRRGWKGGGANVGGTFRVPFAGGPGPWVPGACVWAGGRLGWDGRGEWSLLRCVRLGVGCRRDEKLG